MGCFNTPRNHFHAPIEHHGRRDRSSTLPAIVDEVAWRTLPYGCVTPPPEAQVIASRWQSLSAGTEEVEAETSADFHVVKIALRNMNVRLSVAGRTVLDGVATAGTFHVTPPSTPVRGVFRGAYDALHLFVPNTLFTEFDRDIPGHGVEELCPGSEAVRDSILEWLGLSLLEANRIDGYSGRIYVDSLSMAIVARLRSIARRSILDGQSKIRGLPRWRLKRAVDYIESHLAGPLSLADLASATGLTRMHFAAEFRAATGLRPHEYLLRRRIERSQEMLVATNMSLVNVALAVGFQTQSHYSSVFRRFVGQPPRAWLQAQCNEDSPSRRAPVPAFTVTGRSAANAMAPKHSVLGGAAP